MACIFNYYLQGQETTIVNSSTMACIFNYYLQDEETTMVNSST